MSPARVTGVRRHGTGYEARIQIRGRMTSRSFATWDEAVRWRNKQLEAVGNGSRLDTSSGRMTLGAWWELWQAGRIKRPNTIAREESAWRTYIEPRWATVPLRRISRVDAQAWVKSLTTVEGLALASVARVVHIVSAAIQAAVDDDLVDRNAFRRLSLPEADGDESRFATAAEAHAIEVAMDDHWSLMVPVFMDVGLRLSEMCGLRVRDVAFASPNWTVRVEQIVTEPHGRIEIGPPKTKAGVRTIPLLTPEIANRVSAHIVERGLGPDDLLFTGRAGHVTSPKNWRSRVFVPAVRAAGLYNADKPLTPHSLRHGAVTGWISAGLTDHYRLAKWLGHANPSTALRLYGHLLPEEDQGDLTGRMADARKRASEMSSRAPVVGITGSLPA